jgi:hypothetical protein
VTPRRLLDDCRGASAAEFALVLPLLLLLLFGVIDVGRYMWEINRAEKAAQMGVRMAVVTDLVAPVVGMSYVGQCSPALTQGDVIPADCFATISCSKTSSAASCGAASANNAAFDRILARIQNFLPEASASNLQIIYSPSGLGYAGNPNGPDLAPLVTVQLSGLTFRPIVALALANVGLPQIRSSLTFEDGVGTTSN